MPLISVLLPCWNAAETLDGALGSLERQSCRDFEIVAVDDGSTDETPRVFERWQRQEPRLKLVRTAHGGIVKALNAGLSACTGELVARMDADDLSHPRRLEMQAAFLSEHPQTALVSCQVRGFPQEALREGLRIYIDWQNTLLSDADIHRELFVESPFAHPSVMVRREWLERLGGYEEHGWAEDYDLWMRLALAGAAFAKLEAVLLDWRDTLQRLTRSDPRYSLENFIRLKAHYLALGPLKDRESVIVWGAGMVGRRLGRQLIRCGVPVTAFLDIDPRKIGRTRHRKPVLDARELPGLWQQQREPALLAAVGSRGARQIIRKRLEAWGLVEGKDWWAVA